MPETNPAAGDEPVLNDSARALFRPFTFATLSTTNRDGSPQVTMVAAFVEEHEGNAEIVLFHRGWYQKQRNIRRNPEVALTIVPSPGVLPRYPPQYFVVYGTARIQEGDAGPWSDRLHAHVAEVMPPGSTLAPAIMPDNGGYTTRIVPTRVGGLGPWSKMLRPPDTTVRPS